MTTNTLEWSLYHYQNTFPIETEQYEDDKPKTRIEKNELVEFKLKRAEQFESYKGNLEVKFVGMLRSSPTSGNTAFYRILAITKLSPSTARYTIYRMKIDGNRFIRNKNVTNGIEYCFKFLEDAINNCVYGDVEFEGKNALITLPSVYKRGSTAVSVGMTVKAELQGLKLFDISVDGEAEKSSLKKVNEDVCATIYKGTLLTFNIKDISKVIDGNGLHSENEYVKKTILTDETWRKFQESIKSN